MIARTADQLAPIGLTKIIAVRQRGRPQANGRLLRPLGNFYSQAQRRVDERDDGERQGQGGDGGIRQWIGMDEKRRIG